MLPGVYMAPVYMVNKQLIKRVDCTCIGLAPCHTFLLPGRVDIQSIDTTGLAVSSNSPAFSMAKARLQSCMPHINDAQIEPLLTGRLTYGKTLETNTFQFSSPDYVYMLLFGMGCMSVSTGLYLSSFFCCCAACRPDSITPSVPF